MEGFQKREIVTDDGVRLAIYDRPCPAGPDAPVLFLVNGLGGNLIAWRHQFNYFGGAFRICTWDYRGLYGSALDADTKRRGVALDIPRQARDAIAVMDAFEVERATFIGWSMGVQLNFELAQRITDRVDGLIQVAGSYGRSLSTTAFGRAGQWLAIPAMNAFKVFTERGGRQLVNLAMDASWAFSALSKAGLIAPSIDVELVREVVREYVKLDFEVYNRILQTLGEHDAWPALPSLSLPVLVIVGERDPMTPAWLSKKMVGALPDAELEVIRGASHYVPIEFPERTNAVIDAWMRRKLGHHAR